MDNGRLIETNTVEPRRCASAIRRVGLLLPNLDGGGAELVVLRLAEGLLQRGIEVDLLLGKLEGEHQSKVPAGINVINMDVRFPAFLWKYVGLVRYLRAVRPCALIASLDVIGVSIWARSSAGSGTPLVEWVHTALSPQVIETSGALTATLRRFAIQASYRRADAIVAVSQGVADDLARMLRTPDEHLHVVYNPVINEQVFRMAREPVLHQWFAPGEPPVIIGVGRLVKQKDYATLVRAFAKVRRRRPARLVILGRTDKREPNVQAELDALAESLGIAADFSILGFAENPYSYMARSAVLVSSSIYEGFGMVLAEALAVGTPVVATDCPSGPAEVLDNGRFGTLVPVGDPTAMAAGILKTIESPVPKDVLCERGALFSQSRGTERHLAILNSLVASRTRAARVAVLDQA